MTSEYTKPVSVQPDSDGVIRIGKYVVCAAMKMNDGLIVTGIRHFSPEMRKVLHRIYGDKYHLKVEEEGFVDEMGKFLNREDAWILALTQNQIRKECSCPGTLYSENLY